MKALKSVGLFDFAVHVALLMSVISCFILAACMPGIQILRSQNLLILRHDCVQ